MLEPALWPRPATPDREARLGAAIAGLGVAVPETVMTNAPIAARIGVSEEWIVQRTGISERRVAAPGESLVDYATMAGERALAAAGVAARDIDLVLVATMSNDELTPGASPRTAAALGAGRAAAIDLNAACNGFVSALSVASAQIESGRAVNALVIGADLMTRITDPDDRATAALFGDGAGAVVLRRTGRGRIGPVVLGSDGANGDLIRASRAEGLMRMQGHETFRHAVERMCEVSVAATAAAGCEIADVDLFVYHQANSRILSAIGARLMLPSELVVDCIGRYGNTSAATIPLALDEADANGALRDGSKVLLAAFGAGLTWGATVVEWGVEAMPPEGWALVTGASRGIGAATAKALAAQGWPVRVNYRADEEGAREVVAAIEAAGGSAEARQGDVAANAEVESLLAADERGPVLVLVNNAGLRRDGLSPQLSDEEWQEVVDVNLTGAFRTIRTALPPMLRARFGRVVNVSSVVGLRANAGQANYAAAKAGLIGMTKTVAAEVARRGITVNAVAPGFVETKLSEGAIDERVLAAIPARRPGTPEEVAACIAFLASEGASYVTGTTLTVDGGLSA